jgi:hypothetical protein
MNRRQLFKKLLGGVAATALPTPPEPVTSPGGNVKFDPVDYMGQWGWRNIPDTFDPLTYKGTVRRQSVEYQETIIFHPKVFECLIPKRHEVSHPTPGAADFP